MGKAAGDAVGTSGQELEIIAISQQARTRMQPMSDLLADPDRRREPANASLLERHRRSRLDRLNTWQPEFGSLDLAAEPKTA
jgi:hypothetical protein